MNKLYNKLQSVLGQMGWSIAPFCENTFDDGDRTLNIEITDLHPIQAGFQTMEATITFTFLNGNSWEENSVKLWESLCSFIPLEDRIEEYFIPDNSNELTLLDIPEYNEIVTEQDEDTGTTSSSVTVTIIFNFN